MHPARIFLFLLLTSLGSFIQAQDFFDKANNFLLTNVHEGRLNYRALNGDPGLFDLVGLIAAYDLSNKDDQHKLAFYINSYNILTIYQITTLYPINSPLEVDGFFDEKTFKVAGEDLTLDQLEHQRIFDMRIDPRIHFVLGCGASSCPFLQDNAYRPDILDEQLELRTQLLLDRPNYVEVYEDKAEVLVSKVFHWYKKDFMAMGSLTSFINKYRHYKIPEEYTIVFDEYDWTLNDLKELS